MAEGAMVERVARGICKAAGFDPDMKGVHGQAMVFPKGHVIFHEGEPLWVFYVSEARAAIEAMREPTEAMSIAGCPIEDRSGAPYCYDRSVTDAAWRGMVAAALGENPSP